MATIDSLQRLLEKDTDFVKTFFDVLHKYLRKHHKKISHLRFAQQTTYGWSFFMKKSIPWDDLHVIAKEVARQHTHCPFHIIAEKVSYYINLPDIAT